MTDEVKELAVRVYAELITAGVAKDVAQAFICFRFHPECAWGLGRVKIGDIQGYAIVRPKDDSMKDVECVFATVHQGMPVSELQGLEQIPEKSQLN